MAADDDPGAYWTRLTGSSVTSRLSPQQTKSESKNEKPTTSGSLATSVAPKKSVTPDWIASRAKLIFGSYRRDDFADPESFLLQLGMVLERYKREIIERVTDPRTGIQKSCTFPPSIAEITAYCDEEVRRSTYSASWDQRSQEQLEERARYEAEDTREPLEHRRAVAERIQDQLRMRGFKFKNDALGADERKMHEARLREYREGKIAPTTASPQLARSLAEKHRERLKESTGDPYRGEGT